ncbi:MAG: CDP-glucose 4,6-dehydratase [Elusimicrobiota bacterium]
MRRLDVYRGLSVLVTGHTGFKGGWLVSRLKALGAKIRGYALPAETTPSFFDAARVFDGMASCFGDIRDRAAVARVVRDAAPEIVFHLAAQPLVRRSYREPYETFETNVMGTASVLEACRLATSVKAVVVVTTDKCYENPGEGRPFREDDRLGGHDPYSASKASCELLCSSYRQALLEPEGRVALATARAGNVIGGGDWSADRIIPDAVRALTAGIPLRVRQSSSVRPWQHVLDPISGYLQLGAALLEQPARFSSAWNFGPDDASCVSVAELVDMFSRAWGVALPVEVVSANGQPHEAKVLKLDWSKAARELGWGPVWGLEDALRMTAQWYRDHARDSAQTPRMTARQIAAYEDAVGAAR